MAACEMPNSRWITSTIAPAVCSPGARTSRMRRRTGSPSTSKARTETAAGLATEISSRGTVCGFASGRFIGAGGDRSPEPLVAASTHKILTFLGGGPGGSVLGIDGGSRRKVPAEAHEREVPANADSTGTKLIPSLIRHMGDMFKPKAGAAVGQFREVDLDP